MSILTKSLKWFSFGYETFLAIPFVGGMIILAYEWIPLGIALILHLVTLIFSIKTRHGKIGSILGIITSIIGLVPFVGWVMHVATAITLLVSSIIDLVKQPQN